MSSSEAKRAEKIGINFKMNSDSFTSAVSLYAYMTSCYKHMLAVNIYILISFKIY